MKEFNPSISIVKYEQLSWWVRLRINLFGKVSLLGKLNDPTAVVVKKWRKYVLPLPNSDKIIDELRRIYAVHVPSEQLAVFHKGQFQFSLNKALLDKQNCWENLEQIKKLHQERLVLHDLMEETFELSDLKKLDQQYTAIEFALQDAWKFPRDARFHRTWLRPKCSCPRMDNEDRYPTGYYVISENCLLHGSLR